MRPTSDSYRPPHLFWDNSHRSATSFGCDARIRAPAAEDPDVTIVLLREGARQRQWLLRPSKVRKWITTNRPFSLRCPSERAKVRDVEQQYYDSRAPEKRVIHNDPNGSRSPADRQIAMI
jgi:hypothetical protein